MKKVLAIIGVLVLVLNMVCLPVYAEQTDLDRVFALIDALPESYQVGNGDIIAEIDAIIEANGFTRTELGTARYIKYYTKHKNPHNTWLTRSVYQDRIKINWQEKNPLTCADMFEYEGVTPEDIKNKPGIVMRSYNNEIFPGNLTSGNYIGFYETKSVKEKYPSTFPDTYGEYYITENSVQFGYSGISQNMGDITYNGGIVSVNHGIEIPFDGYTKYSKVSLLVSGTNYLSGEYARQLFPAVVTVYYKDGTKDTSFHIAGLFCYSYRMALYSMLDGVTYSEYLGTNPLAKEFDTLWYPNEANVSSYFKMGDGLNSRLSYKKDTSIGNAAVITVDTKNKEVDKVEIACATEKTLLDMGAKKPSKYTTREETPKDVSLSSAYLLPIDKQQLKDKSAYEAERDYYIGVVSSSSYPLYLHAVTGSKTQGSSYAEEIAEIEEKINAFPESFNASLYEEINVVKNRFEFLLNQGVAKGDFSADAVQKLERLLNYNIENGKYVVYVSPEGKDNASGSREDPLKTLEGARSFVRKLEKTRPVDVIFLGGEYNFSETVNFYSEDSGTEEFPITYKSEEKAVFTSKDTVSFKDFTLVKAGEDSRIPTDLIGKIYKIDLNKKGIYPGDMPVFQSTGIMGDGYDDVNFFVNNKEQMVAQWPNGESNYDTWTDLVNTNINTGIIKAHSVRSKRWQGEKFAYFEGYPSPDYSNERNNIEIEGDLIKFKNPSRFNLDENHSRRYKVKHLLSELDVPGEWYLDRTTNIFYYYPVEDFDEDAVIEFSSRKIDLISLKNVKNVNFDGITFDKIRGGAIYASNSLEKLNIYNCEFTNISNDAVEYDATPRYDGYLANVSNFKDGASNCEIRNNKFVNIGASAILFRGGDRELLTGGKNIIANNYIYNAGNKQRCTAIMSINGAYNYVLNNEAHFMPFHALNHSGNENVIAYNEFYDALRDTGDCGVVYSGRQFATRGTEIAYNYIHHHKHLDERTSDNGVGIYLDDRLSGIYVHHNILYADGIGQNGNGIQNGSGMHNIINYNTIVDADESMTRSNRFVEDYGSTFSGTSVINEIVRISGIQLGEKIIYDDGVEKTLTASDAKGRYELYFEKYPELEKTVETLINPNESVPAFVEKYPFILTHPNFTGDNAKYGNLAKDIQEGKDLTKYRLLSLRAPMENTYIGNVANTPWRRTAEIDQVYSGFGGVEQNNVEDASKDIFMDPENQDFRIKADLGFEGYIDETFELDTIGLQADGSVSYDFDLADYEVKNAKSFSAEEKRFNLTYPENNGKVDDKKNITFMWERPVSSDYFTLEIATDKEMQNIVYKNEMSYYNFETVTSLPEDVNTFYWRVTARNIGRNDGSVWLNSDGVNVFHTYDGAYQEMPASIPFDISTDFNVDLFNDEGEVASKVNLGGGSDLGMYNLTNLKRIVPEDGYFKYIDTIYHFPQVSYATALNNAIRVTKGERYTYKLKTSEKGNYDKIKLAMSCFSAAKDYNIIAHYKDGSYETAKVALHQYYTTYYSYEQADIILTVDGVNSKGQIISQLNSYNKNKIYQAVIDTDENKVLESIEFVGGSGTVYNSGANQEYIFAITGIKTQRDTDKGIEKSFFINNYSDKDKDLVIIITGTKNSKPVSKIFNITLEKNKIYQTFDIEIPEDVYNWENIQMFTWENGKLSPFTGKQGFFN